MNLIPYIKDGTITELYSLIEGKMLKVRIDGTNTINAGGWKYSPNGSYAYAFMGECLLFPSKEERDWDKWLADREAENKPKIGDLVIAWDKNEDESVIGIINDVDGSGYPYLIKECGWYNNARKITLEEATQHLQNLLNANKCKN